MIAETTEIPMVIALRMKSLLLCGISILKQISFFVN